MKFKNKDNGHSLIIRFYKKHLTISFIQYVNAKEFGVIPYTSYRRFNYNLLNNLIIFFNYNGGDYEDINIGLNKYIEKEKVVISYGDEDLDDITLSVAICNDIASFLDKFFYKNYNDNLNGS